MPPLITRETLAKLRQTVYDHMSGYIALAYGPDLIDRSEVERLVMTGVISYEDGQILLATATDETGRHTPLNDAFVSGMVIQRLLDAGRRSGDITHRQLLEELQANPLPIGPAGAKALDWCRHGAAVHCRHLGDRLVTDIESTVWRHHDELRDSDEAAVRDGTSAAIAGKRSPRWLKATIRETLGDAAGDLDRIAATELQDARNEGAASYVLDTHGARELVVKVPNPSACQSCLDLYMDGENPRVFEIGELRANGTNHGRRRADWRPVVGTTHPWCACDLQRLPPGFEYRNGSLRVIGRP